MKTSAETAATRLVARKTRPMLQETRESFWVLELEAMLEETVKKTRGTMIMKMALRKRSPRGRIARAAGGEKRPRSRPAPMERMRRSEKP